jgi:hypothetical protein
LSSERLTELEVLGHRALGRHQPIRRPVWSSIAEGNRHNPCLTEASCSFVTCPGWSGSGGRSSPIKQHSRPLQQIAGETES